MIVEAARVRRIVCALISLLAAVSIAKAEAPAKGKEVTLYVGSGPGGAYDIYARLVARHLGSHLPGNPTVLVSNMPGAAGRRLISWIYHGAPKDGRPLAQP